ncbi:MAG: DUF1800 domain-containing protein [Steroidobacteraceae bacterium]
MGAGMRLLWIGRLGRSGLTLLATAWLLLACAGGAAVRTASRDSASAALWIDRVSYGVNSATWADYERLGPQGYLRAQLHATPAPLPAAAAAQIAQLQPGDTDPARLLIDINAENKRIAAMPEGPDKEQARKQLSEQGDRLAYQAARRHLLRAIYSPAQLREQMVWFWLNHFSVYQYKANVRWLVGDYEEQAIRPHALGHFRDLVLATLTHPAMLQYLDNAQNSVGHLNENYARELMELHVLGVDGGYTQQDVQALARILTGAGIVTTAAPPQLKTEWQPLYRRVGAFEFNPARHDFTPKMLLGRRIDARGFAEIEQAVDILVKQPACARFISKRLAQYFVADDPPPQLVERMAQTFQHSDGDITQVLQTLFDSGEFRASLGHKFRDPMHFVVAALRLAYDDRVLVNAHPVVSWLGALGEPLYGRQTPDGYALTEAAWASSGQMSRRFEIGRTLSAGPAGLFEPEDGTHASDGGFPQLAGKLYYAAIEPRLSVTTRMALQRAASQTEWNTFLLASPEFNYH